MPTGNPVGWTLLQRARASFDAERSGDLILFLKPHVMPIPDPTSYVATHGSPWDYDRRVPILFWRRGQAPAAPEDAVETTDIMPTLAAMMGLPLASPAIDGHCLSEVVSCPGNANR
jgi:arylsulfatase A-like enzyme